MISEVIRQKQIPVTVIEESETLNDLGEPVDSTQEVETEMAVYNNMAVEIETATGERRVLNTIAYNVGDDIEVVDGMTIVIDDEEYDVQKPFWLPNAFDKQFQKIPLQKVN